MRYNEDVASAHPGGRPLEDPPSQPLVIATIFRENGSTGIHTHVRQLRRYLERRGVASTVITPFSWARLLTYPVFGPRLVLARCSKAASVVWYRYWHEVFLRKALRRRLVADDNCVIYAQGPVEARAALDARRGRHQRVVMAVHFRTSLADEHAEPGREIKPDGVVFRAIRRAEREAIPRLDGIVYVADWARSAILTWLPEAAAVPSAIIGNFVEPVHPDADQEPLGDLVSTGKLEERKNHRFLLEVVAEAKRAGRSLTLDVFGDGPLRKDLLRQTRCLGIEEQVRFHGFRSNVRDFLPRYRAYVHAAKAECLPLAIIEAMAAGLPIVAGDTGGVSELVVEGVEGRFWPLDDPARAAAVLIGLMDDEAERSKAAARALARFRRDFDAEVVAPRLLSFVMGTDAREPGARRALSLQRPTRESEANEIQTNV
jgi:glycosyltransferase involved in cell wall biosynthesis